MYGLPKNVRVLPVISVHLSVPFIGFVYAFVCPRLRV